MNILIVDDEQLIRKNLIYLVENSYLNFKQIYEASDAFNAIDIIEKVKPEIILTDIRMSQKNGLDIAKYVHENFPELIVILITGYSDFDYAKAGIEYKVFDYILKPVDTELAVNCIEKAQKQYQHQQKKQELYEIFKTYFADNYDIIKRQFFQSLLFHPTEQKGSVLYQQKNLFHLDFDYYRLISFKCILDAHNNHQGEEYYYSYIVEKYLSDNLKEPITYSFGSTVYLIYPVKNDNAFDDNEELIRLLTSIKTFVEKAYLFTVHIGISKVARSLHDIKELKNQTSICLEYQSNHNNNEYIFYDDISNTVKSPYNINDYLTLLNTHVYAGNRLPALDCLKSIFDSIHDMQSDYVLSTFNLIVSDLSFVLYEINLDSTDISNLRNSITNELKSNSDIEKCMEYISNWVACICDTVNESFKSKNNMIVDDICDYINKNYSSNQISLTVAAQYVRRNPSYISRLIKQYTGKSFTQILTEKRIEEAKSLLGSSNLKISDIAERVGYTNIRYFNRIFSSYTGMTANDYRKVISTFS